jgi:hypothetical protein
VETAATGPSAYGTVTYFVNGKSLGACPAKVAMSGQPVVPFVDLFNPGDEVTLIRDS